MTALPFEPDAAAELEAAATWYERQRAGYGALFLDEVRRIAQRAARFPESGPRVARFDPAHDVRRFPLASFPYAVVTAIVGGELSQILGSVPRGGGTGGPRSNGGGDEGGSGAPAEVGLRRPRA